MKTDDKQNLNLSQTQAGQKLSNKLSEIALKEKEQEVKNLADSLNVPYVNLDKFPIAQEAIKLIPQEQAESLQTLCFLYTGDEIRLGSLNPTNPQVSILVRELSEKYHANVRTYMISENSFALAFEVYNRIPTIIQMEGVNITAEDLNKFDAKLVDFKTLNDLIQKTNLTETLNLIIAAGLKFEASDVHIEAEKENVKIRFRIDGVLHDTATLDLKSWPKINSRIKLLAALKLNLGKKPQDGRFTIHLEKSDIDVRVSIIPSSYGESIVLRLLRTTGLGLEMEALGLKGKAFVDLKNQMTKPNGMIISTGPTGSGKTTTLYSILNKLNNPENKIITLEDPIEYKLPGIVQSQVDSALTETNEAGPMGEVKESSQYTFAKGLRALLRQDPDIVMVGEVRDLETADTAINAALTGHLMLTSMHTNSAAGTIPRLLAMGVKKFLLAPALNAIIGQRLLRKLCPECKTEDTKVDNNTMTMIMNALNNINPESGYKPSDLSNLKFFTAPGCPACHGLGYRGRIGVFEILTMNPEIEKVILSGEISEYQIEKIAVANGMITMLQDGLLKALDGITSISEVMKEVKD